MHGGCLSRVARPRAVHWLRAETELPSKGYFRSLATGVDHPPARVSGLQVSSAGKFPCPMDSTNIHAVMPMLGFNTHPCRHASARHDTAVSVR